MEFTKEECVQALIELTPEPMSIYIGDVMTLQKLINEHFDNPPLKFEEMKEMIGKPVYHDSLKRWFVIGDVCINAYRQKLIKVCHNIVDVLFFEENVFFAREVKE